MKKLFIIALMFLSGISLAPQLTFAVGAPPALDYSGFVNCDGVVKKDGTEPGRQTECNFAELMKTVQKGINWMFFISVPLAGVLFAWCGLLYMSGKPGNRTKANTIFTSVAVGFIIMLTAWIVVRTVVGWFVDPTVDATIFLDSSTK